MNKEENVSNASSFFSNFDKYLQIRSSVINKTAPITDEEIKYILNIFESLGVYINTTYLMTEKDIYGDIYIDMFLNTCINDEKMFDQIQNELDLINELFDINYEVYSDGLGKEGTTTYDFYHYFMW